MSYGINLNNKDNRLAWRYVPENAKELKDENCIVYLYTTNKGQLAAIGYKGTASKPSLHYTFPSEERRLQRVNEWRVSIAERQDRINERRQQRSSFENPYKIGDILDSSWGYEQTNIDFYQVTSVKGQFVTIRQIAGNREYQGQDYGTVVAVKDSFLKDSSEIRKKVTTYNGKDGYINLTSYSSASLWDGQPRSWSSWY